MFLSWMAAAAISLTQQAKPIPPPSPPQTDALVGVFYFPGWCSVERWYCIAANDRVLHPLLGYYREGDPEVADWHIKWAADHGVSFFAFDFYTHEGTEMLEAALEGFLQSRFVGSMKFCLNWCNHAPASTMTAEHLARFADLVIPRYLKHPSYMRIRGEPLVIILSGYSFVKTLGVEGARKAFQDFDERCRAAGLPGVHLMSCEGEIVGEQALRDSLAAGIQGFCLYNYPYAGAPMTGPGRYMEATYEDMIAQGEQLWKHWGRLTEGRFWPTVMPGWDRRPWLRDNDLLRTGSNPALFRRSLERAREHMNEDRVVMIEAWNEWGEGSVLEPTVEHGFAYLQQVQEVFSPGSRPTKPPTPASLRRPAPVFRLELPRVTRWGFDFGLEGWTGKGVTDLHAEHGAVHFVTASNDPQLWAPYNYVDCGLYPRVRIRMRVSLDAAEPVTVPAQIFWSTVEYAMREDTSITFDVAVDDQWHVYELDLSKNPKWTGLADGLRLDPGDRAGLRVHVDEVRFLPRDKR